MKAVLTVLVLAGLLMQTGCGTTMTPSQQSTAIGSGVGAALGAILGNNLGGSRNDRELGIAAGALAGGLLGHQMGTQREMQNQVNNLQQQQFITTVWVENSNGSKTPVQLRQTDGGQYVGPRGEYYSVMPTQEQLRKVYGM
jgi:uncharacterized protein YcfJ